MMWGFGLFASGTQVAKLLDKGVEVRPYIITTYCFKCFVLSNMTCKDMIMFVLKDFESEVCGIWYKNPIILTK